MKIYVGTSGYSYFWNEGKPDQLSWYISKGFNTVEINSTFYSFPSYAAIKRWSRVNENFVFSVKVNKFVTHYSKLSSIETFQKFYDKFEPMISKIKFWLFQMPPTFDCRESNIKRLESFIKKISLNGFPVIEFRDPCWWKLKDSVIKLGYNFCSVSAPGLPDEIVINRGIIYMRFHGLTDWYAYEYSEKELLGYYKMIIGSNAKEAYLYFNNDTGMLENALFMLNLSRKT